MEGELVCLSECFVSLPTFPFPLWGNFFACVLVSVFSLSIFSTICYFVHRESGTPHTSKDSLCPEVLSVLDWGPDCGSFIIWRLVGRCGRKSALDRLRCVFFFFWTSGTRFSTSFTQLRMFRDLHFLFCVAGSTCSSEAELLGLYLRVMEVMGFEK